MAVRDGNTIQNPVAVCIVAKILPLKQACQYAPWVFSPFPVELPVRVCVPATCGESKLDQGQGFGGIGDEARAEKPPTAGRPSEARRRLLDGNPGVQTPSRQPGYKQADRRTPDGILALGLELLNADRERPGQRPSRGRGRADHDSLNGFLAIWRQPVFRAQGTRATGQNEEGVSAKERKGNCLPCARWASLFTLASLTLQTRWTVCGIFESGSFSL